MKALKLYLKISLVYIPLIALGCILCALVGGWLIGYTAR